MFLSRKQREPVLIYFSNETHLTPQARRNYAAVAAVLRTDRVGKGRQIAFQLVSDLHDFQSAVRTETEILTKLAKNNTNVKIIIFTNYLSYRRKALIGCGGAVKEITFHSSASSDYIIESAPNSSPDTLLKCLTLAGEVFSPTSHSFTLVIKSHASENKLITPRLTVHNERLTAKDILRMANGQPAPERERERLPSIGVSAADFLSVIGMAKAQPSLSFEHVFLEVCAGRVVFSETDCLPANVSTLTATSSGLEYVNIDYAALTDNADPIRFLQNQIRDRFPFDTMRSRCSSVFELSMWWFPLVAVIIGWIIS